MLPETQTTERSRALLAASAALALFWVVFLWGWWQDGPYALGANMSLFLIALLAAGVRIGLQERKFFSAKNLAWIMPLLLIGASYALYDNPFIKIVNLFAIPVFAMIFLTYAAHPRAASFQWGAKFVVQVIERWAWILGLIPKSALCLITALSPRENDKWRAGKRAALGLILLAVIGTIIVAPLLGSADPTFGSIVSTFYDWLGQFIDPELAGRIFVFVILLIGILSLFFSLRQSRAGSDDDGVPRQTDSLIAGIVLAGILGLYVIFLWLQINRLWVNQLPIDFKTTESLVKSGFWQLFVLTILNIAFFFACYRRTNKPVQRLLLGFATASLLLLGSAAWRLVLYVFGYGFSYEKFYASYTVVFCAVLLIWLIGRMFASARANLLKAAVFLLLWMYAVIAIAPVEQFVFRANLALSARQDSRINRYEMTMLSPDVLGQVEETYKKSPQLLEGWDQWIADNKEMVAKKAWYEMNVMNLFYLAK